MDRNTSFTEGLARSIGYILGTLVGSKPGAQGQKIVPANFEPVRTVQKAGAAIETDVQSTSMAHLDPIGTRLAQYRPALTRNVPLEGGLGTIQMRIHESQQRVDYKLEIHSPKLRKAAGLDRQVFAPIFYDPADLGGMSVTDFAVAKSVHTVQTFLNGKIAEMAASASRTSKPKGKEQSAPVAAAPEPKQAPAEPQSSGEAEPVTVKAQSSRETLQFVGEFVGSGTGTRTSRDRKTKEVTQYDQFYVDILDVALGKNLNRIWGTDLARAMEVSGVEKGDLIQITNLGRIPVELPSGAKEKDKKAFKISYDIKKL